MLTNYYSLLYLIPDTRPLTIVTRPPGSEVSGLGSPKRTNFTRIRAESPAEHYDTLFYNSLILNIIIIIVMVYSLNLNALKTNRMFSKE